MSMFASLKFRPKLALILLAQGIPTIAALTLLDRPLTGSERTYALLAVAAVLVVVGTLGWWVTSGILRKISTAGLACDAIAAGNFEAPIVTREGGDEIDSLLRSVTVMRDTLHRQLETERTQGNENQRMRQALDSSSSAVMLADTRGDIVFVNRAAVSLFRGLEGELRGVLPRFAGADKIVGASFDIFHRNAGQQRGMLEGLKSGHTAVISLGSRKMRIAAYPVLGTAGERLGVAVEWQDRTAELAAEKEVEAVINAAADGDLSRRLKLEGKADFLLLLSRQVNSLLEINQKVFGEVQRVFNALANGRLTEKVAGDYKGDFALVKTDANATVDKLVEMVQSIQMTADLVNSGALQLSSGNENLSRRTTEQAASLEETAASMEELTSTVRHNADNAAEANQVSTATRALAEKGGQVVGRAVQAMSEINDSSKRIADIIGVIDEIAFQTNLLALNAAVEAARAGEQGRGFAVVASEVRNLARRSADSAKEIKTLIEDSVRKVEGGSQLVDESGQTLGEIVSSVKRVTDLIAEISAAGREQASGVEEVNKTVTQMDQVTTQNAALVDEANTATNALVGQARSLSELLSFFSIGAPARHATAAAPAKAAAPPTATPIAARVVGTAPARKPLNKARTAPVSARATHAAVAPAGANSFKDDGDDWSTF